MEDRPTTSMKKGWLCKTSYDEKNWEIEPVDWDGGSSDDDDDLVMIQLWLSSFDNDPMMIIALRMIQWWSNFNDDLVYMIRW